jgi:hypothetical protein
LQNALRSGCVAWISFAVLACGCSAPSTETVADAGPVRLRLVEDLRLDADAEDFSLIGRVAVRHDGATAVALPQDMQTRFYDSDGRPVATVGVRAGGPGEFQHLGAMTWIGDTLVIDDQRLRRVTYIDAAGDVLRAVTLHPPFAPKQFSPTSADTTFRFFITQSASAGGNIIGIASVDVGPLTDGIIAETHCSDVIAADGSALRARAK